MTLLRLLLRQLVVLPVRVYRLALSPLLPRACRFEPTCSAYAVDAIVLHGIPRGGYLSLRRILRCHPWSEPGIDQVPTPVR